jgi:transposase
VSPFGVTDVRQGIRYIGCMAIPTRRIRLRRGDRARLETWLRTRTIPQRQVERARIVLGSALGKSSYELAEELGLSRPTIQRWLDRYEAEGLQGLEDRPRSGRPRTVTPDVEAEVVEKTLKEDPPQGTHWSTRLMAEETDLHHSQVARIWRAHGAEAVPGEDLQALQGSPVHRVTA